LRLRDIPNSVYICNTLQFRKTDISYSWCDTTVCDRNVSAQMHERDSRPGVRLFRRAGVLGASVLGTICSGAPVWGHLSGGVRPDTTHRIPISLAGLCIHALNRRANLARTPASIVYYSSVIDVQYHSPSLFDC